MHLSLGRVEVHVVVRNDSGEAKEALRWAIEEARLRQATLRAVRVWRHPAIYVHGYLPPDLLDRGLEQDRMKHALDAVVAEVAGESPPVPLERIIVEGPTAQVLVDAADEADLLVVGSRGHGGFTGLLLGSVSQQCVHHARCTVVIVRK